MEQKRGAELSDSALEGVAGGINTVSINSGNYTYTPGGTAAAGPAGGDSFEIESAGGKNCLDLSIIGLLKEAGTLDQYYRDFSEYNEQCKAWDKKYYTDPFKRGPEPMPPNPYDYL